MAEKWTLMGRIVVDHLLPELAEVFGKREGVPGVIVKVSARSKVLSGWGMWNIWDKVTTDADGSFRVSESHGSDRRQFKAEVLFDSDRLRLKEGQETSIGLDGNGFPLDIDFDLTDKDWFEVHNDKDRAAEGRKAGVSDLGDIPVTGAVARRLADTWSLLSRVMDLLERYGPAYAFDKRLVVKYPMGLAGNRPASASYVNPLTLTVHIKEDEWETSTLLHEMSHALAFQLSTGEDAMAWQLFKHGSTHQTRENTTFVPHHEAFGDWFAQKLLKEITDGKLSNFLEGSIWEYPDLPLNRSYIGAALTDSERHLANVPYTSRGWHSLFNILTSPCLDRCDFNRRFPESDGAFCYVRSAWEGGPTRLCPEVQTGYSLKDVLSIWLKHPNKGIESFMGKDDLNFSHFLARAGAILPRLEQEKIRMIKACLDPNSTVNPCPA